MMDPQRLATLQSSNEAPPGAESITLIESIQKIQTPALPLLNEETPGIRPILDDGESKWQRHLPDELAGKKAITSPIQYLPLDTLEEIFIHCLPTTHNAVISQREPPLLTSICSRWRHISIAIPQLWSSIKIEFNTICSFNDDGVFTMTHRGQDMSSVKRTKMAIQEWLVRARGLPLSISFKEGPCRMADSSFIADSIKPFLHRCRSLDMSVHTHGFLPTTSSDFSIMESLSLSQDNTDEDLPHELPEAPRLRKLSVWGLPIDLAAVPDRWPLLTSISIGGGDNGMHPSFTFKQLVSLLRTVPRLVIGSFGFSSRYSQLSADSDDSEALARGNGIRIRLPTLKDLSIFCDQPWVLLNLFHSLHLPVLQGVQISDASADVWDSGLVSEEFALLAAISQTRETLRHLTINTRIYSQGEVYMCLEECQLLTTLSILGSKIDDEFLQRFIPYQGSPTPVLCPSLEHMDWEGTSRITDGCLLRFIIQRQTQVPGSAKLKSISVRFYRPQDEDVRPQLANYIADGLRVTLRYREDEEE